MGTSFRESSSASFRSERRVAARDLPPLSGCGGGTRRVACAASAGTDACAMLGSNFDCGRPPFLQKPRGFLFDSVAGIIPLAANESEDRLRSLEMGKE